MVWNVQRLKLLAEFVDVGDGLGWLLRHRGCKVRSDMVLTLCDDSLRQNE